jgi:hypothetical protein
VERWRDFTRSRIKGVMRLADGLLQAIKQAEGGVFSLQKEVGA